MSNEVKPTVKKKKKITALDVIYKILPFISIALLFSFLYSKIQTEF